MRCNWFYIGGKLDRVFLRSSAVYRCLKRYGASEEWAVQKLTELIKDMGLASAMVEQWKK
jgi:hypothetical protein